MNFFARMVSQWLANGNAVNRLAQSKWMQNFAQKSHKTVESVAKTVAENKHLMESAQAQIRQQNTKMKSDIQASQLAHYVQGLRNELRELKDGFSKRQ